MKQFNFLKTLSFLFMVIATTFALASCSSDKDEPENPDNSGYTLSTIPYTDLYGTWLIQNIKNSETGTVVEIDQKIGIGNFSPNQSSDNVTDLLNYQIWSTSYDDVITYDTGEGEQSAYATITFYKENKWSLKSSRVASLIFTLSSNKEGMPYVQSFVMNDLSFSDGILTAKTCAYGTSDDLMNPINGSITMKKL